MGTASFTIVESPEPGLVDDLARRHSSVPPTHVVVRPLSMLSGEEVAAWKGLAARAAEHNPFQEPEFVLPLAKYLLRNDDLRILTVTDPVTGRWFGACVLQVCAPSLSRPLPHLRSLQSPYTFLDSPLIDRARMTETVRDAFDFLRRQRMWHGIRFRLQSAHGRQAAAIDGRARSFGFAIDRDRTWTRATTDLRSLRGAPLIERCSRSRRKSLLRARRWLQTKGKVSHRLVNHEPHNPGPFEEFLRLEAQGWKGLNGTAIACRLSDTAFFKSMIDRFAESKRVVFGELLVGNCVIASTCNLISGPRMFALKLGWDPEFSNGNPGHWAEIELAASLCNERPELEMIDSCSHAGSYVESVATGVSEMSAAVYVWSRRAAALCEMRRQLRVFNRLLK